MTAAKAANLAEVERLMEGWSLLQRVRFAAQWMEMLASALGDQHLRAADIRDWVGLSQEEKTLLSAYDDLLEGEYREAIRWCDGDREPPDDPEAWSGGFAENH